MTIGTILNSAQKLSKKISNFTSYLSLCVSDSRTVEAFRHKQLSIVWRVFSEHGEYHSSVTSAVVKGLVPERLPINPQPLEVMGSQRVMEVTKSHGR